MTFVQNVLYHVSTPILGLGFVATTVLLSMMGLIIVRKFVPIHKLKLHNDVAGFIFTTLGVIYAVLLAFMVIVSWQNFDRSSNNVSMEANCIASVYRDSNGFEPGFRAKLRDSYDKYVNSIINDEWPLLAKGQRSMRTQQLSDYKWKIVASFKARNDTEKMFFQEALRKMNEASELRRQRIVDSATGIHPVLWFVLITGGIITIMFTLFFGTENFSAQIIMTALLACLIGMILMTILVLDYPFTGDVCITPAAFKEVLAHLSKI